MLLEYKKTVYVLRFPHWMPLSNLASTANRLLIIISMLHAK